MTQANQPPARRGAIFRSAAWQRHANQHQESVLPRFIRPQTFTILWCVLLLLALLSGIAWSVELPEQQLLTAVVTDTAAQQLTLTAFVPAQAGTALTIGQPLAVGDDSHAAVVTAHSATVVSPAEIAAQYGVEVTAPMYVVTAVWDSPELPHALNSYDGSQQTLRRQLPGPRLLELLPGIGRLTGGVE